jgi:hypothetical protein
VSRRLPALVAVAIVIAACQVSASGSPPTSSDVVSPVDGVVIAVDSAGLGSVRGFTLRTPSGLSIAFSLGPLENAAQFSPSHLAEHLATSAPVRAWFQVQNGARVVYRLEDAPGVSPAVASPAAT